MTHAAPTQRASEPPADRLEQPRETAVRRVFRGGVITVAASALLLASTPFGVATGWSFALGMAGFAGVGLGLLEIGRAARHFIRFGTRSSQLTVLATAGLGASTAVAGLANWIGVTFGAEVLKPVIHWAMNGVYSFGVLTLLLVLRAVVVMLVDSSGDE